MSVGLSVVNAAGVCAAVMLAGCGGSQQLIATPGEAARDAPLFDPHYATVYTFAGGTDGRYPNASMIAVGETLYGTTAGGGTSHNGTVFQVTTSGTQSVIHRFRGAPSDGASPTYGLASDDDEFFGATPTGGNGPCAAGCGVVYKMTGSGKEVVLYKFKGGQDAANPSGGLVVNEGTLYGPAEASGHGTIFAISATGSERVLYRFKGGRDGQRPVGTLLDDDGTLFGAASGGSGCAGSGCGVIFAATVAGKERSVYSFRGGSDGADPGGSLILENGNLYGTTFAGGGSSCGHAKGCGTIFELSTSGKERVLYRFKGGADGEYPNGGLIDVKGKLYGTTSAGGGSGCASNDGCGTVFEISKAGVETGLHRYKGAAALPQSSLTNVDGTLYGTTYDGGTGGTVFRIAPLFGQAERQERL